MNIYLLIFITFTFKYSAKCMDVGTVLYTTEDNLRLCWSDEEIATLSSRMFFEEMLPAETYFDITNDQFIFTLIDYFRLVVKRVQSSSEGKTRQILLVSLSDCLGGYLHHMLLPLARYAFYCGNVNYSSMAKLNEIYRELKSFLRTDGKTWKAPITNFMNYKNEIKPLIYSEIENPCDELIFYENYNDDSLEYHALYMPMPYMDSDTNPHAIAVPFKNYILRNIQGSGAAFILVRYFITVSKCLEQKQASYTSTFKFYKRFDEFLENKVLGLLENDNFYSAFGGVYRIKKTLMHLFQGKETPAHLKNNKYCKNRSIYLTEIPAFNFNASSTPVILKLNPSVPAYEDQTTGVILKRNLNSNNQQENTKKLVKREQRLTFDDFSGFNSYSDDYVENNYEEKYVITQRQITETAKYKLMFLIMTCIVGILFFLCMMMACLYIRKKRECEPPLPPCPPRPGWKCNKDKCEKRKFQLANAGNEDCIEWSDARPPCPARGFLERIPDDDREKEDLKRKRKKSIRDRFRNILLSQSAHAYPTKSNAPCSAECRSPCNLPGEPPCGRKPVCRNDPSMQCRRSNTNLIDHIYMDSCTTDSSPRTTSPCSNASRRSYGFGRRRPSCIVNGVPCPPCNPETKEPPI